MVKSCSMCNHENNVPSPGYYQNGFVATEALGHMMYVALLPSYYICMYMHNIHTYIYL